MLSVMQIIKRNNRKLNIRDVSNLLLAITVFTSFILVFSIFFVKAKYFGWGTLYFVYPIYISYYVLFALFWVLLVYNTMYKWLVKRWSIPSIIAQVIIIMAYVVLKDIR